MNELTVIAVTERFAIAIDENNKRYRVSYPTKPNVTKGQVISEESFYALGYES